MLLKEEEEASCFLFSGAPGIHNALRRYVDRFATFSGYDRQYSIKRNADLPYQKPLEIQ